MCHKKPGPRCAGHLRTAIADLSAHVEENRVAFTAGLDEPHPGARAKLLQAHDEFDETPTGQSNLYNAMVRTVGNPTRVHVLRARQVAAARRYAVKREALAAIEAGNERAAAIILKTQNPNTGWLEHASLNPLNTADFEAMSLNPDGTGMVGVVRNTSLIEVDVDGAPSALVTSHLVYETNVDSDASMARLTSAAGIDALLGFEDAESVEIIWDENPHVVTDLDGAPVLLSWRGTATGVVVDREATASA